MATQKIITTKTVTRGPSVAKRSADTKKSTANAKKSSRK